MTLIIDAGPLVALADRRDPFQPLVAEILRVETGDLILPAPVAAEVDYLIGKRLGPGTRRAFLVELAEGRFRVECLDPADYGLARQLDEQYADLDLGLADISVVILAHRFRTHRILTDDQRHFRAVRPLDSGSYVLLPFDAGGPDR